MTFFTPISKKYAAYEDELLELQPDTGTLEEKAAYFLEMGVKNVIVTLGKKGVLLKTPQVCHLSLLMYQYLVEVPIIHLHWE
jgi:sugar/nucleoside kinase (ribokinase family)